jgi:DNA replication protein DnaC
MPNYESSFKVNQDDIINCHGYLEDGQIVNGTCKKHGKTTAKVICQKGNSVQFFSCIKCHEEITKEEEKQQELKRYREQQANNQYRRYVIDQSNMPKTTDKYDLDTLQYTTAQDKQMKQKVDEFIDCISRHQFKPLVLLGKVGVGKTLIACCMLKHLVNESFIITAMYVDYYTLADSNAKEMIAELNKPELLIIDDINNEGFSRFTAEKMVEITHAVLYARYNSQKHTCIISNLDYSALVDYLGKRLSDRYMKGSITFTHDGSSKR